MNDISSDNKPEAQNRRAPESRPPALPRAFEFLDSPIDYRDLSAIIVRIPPGIRSKQKLFAIYASTLRFPKYFGWNWDAFEECINDLSWLRLDNSVVIVHEDLPFGPGGENRKIYLDVLRRVVTSTTGSRGMRIIMPTSLRGLLSSAANEPR
jgi:hypothetical protein